MLREPNPDLLNRLRRALFAFRQPRPLVPAAADGRPNRAPMTPASVRTRDPALFAGHPAGMSRRRAAGRLGTALWEVFPAHVALLDRDGFVVSVNRAWREFGLAAGGSPTSGLGSNYLTVCARASADGEPEAQEATDLVSMALQGRDPGRRLAYRVDDGRWFSMQVLPIPGRHSGALVVHTDITSETERERQWQHRALHDPLTGLPNRALLADRLDHAVATAARDPESLAVLFVDLVAFKSVNDRLGHTAGDRVLCKVAARMAGSLRTADTIGRWGGDEFLVIAERLEHEGAGQELADRIRASLDEPMSIAGQELHVQATVGLAHLSDHCYAGELVQAADQALLRARASRGSRLDR